MRRLNPAQRLSVIVPVHVANRLGFMSRETAERLRRELEQVALLASEGGDGTGALHLPHDMAQLYVEADGFRLFFQVDSVNRAVIARSVEEIKA